MITQRRNIGGLVGGSILIGLGVLFLLAQFFNFMAWQFLWPFIVIGAGGLFFVGMLAGGKSAAGLAIPGAIISVVGLMLLYQNLTGHWASWSYGWTIILVAVGLGILMFLVRYLILMPFDSAEHWAKKRAGLLQKGKY